MGTISLPLDAQRRGIPVLGEGIVQTVAVGAASAAITNAVGTTTDIVRIIANTGCHFTIASAPVATTDLSWLPAGVEVLRKVVPGISKVAFIYDAANVAGTAYVTELD